MSQDPLDPSLPHIFDIRDGWLVDAKKISSPNFNSRPPSSKVSLLVIHNISLPPNQFGGGYIEQFFTNRLNVNVHPYFKEIVDLTVSAHCLISREGEVTQFVNFDKRAWHAGRSEFNGQVECNDYSIGIELEGADHIPYTDAQYESLSALTGMLIRHYPLITSERIVGHCDIAPKRKTDPGASFDWSRLMRSVNVNQ